MIYLSYTILDYNSTPMFQQIPYETTETYESHKCRLVHVLSCKMCHHKGWWLHALCISFHSWLTWMIRMLSLTINKYHYIATFWDQKQWVIIVVMFRWSRPLCVYPGWPGVPTGPPPGGAQRPDGAHQQLELPDLWPGGQNWREDRTDIKLCTFLPSDFMIF